MALEQSATQNATINISKALRDRILVIQAALLLERGENLSQPQLIDEWVTQEEKNLGIKPHTEEH